MSLDVNSPIHSRVMNLACVLPFIGSLSGNPTAMITTMVLGGLIAMPYFAVLAEAEEEERKGKQ